jgi:hypothetical protein
MNVFSLYICKLVELDHIKPILVHEFFKFQLIKIIASEQLKELLLT